MLPRVYADFRLMAAREASMSEVAEGASVLFRSLHGAFTHMSGHFALAFPRLDHKSPHARLLVFRVFAESLEDLESLHNFVKGGDSLGRRFRADFPEAVPVDFYGQWKAYKRVRIHARSVPEARAKTMRQLDEAGTSWIDMGSKENGQRFRMYVTVIESNQAGVIGRVNSYGLSIADQLLYLPHIEG